MEQEYVVFRGFLLQELHVLDFCIDICMCLAMFNYIYIHIWLVYYMRFPFVYI